MNDFGKKLFALGVLVLGAAVATPAQAQFGGPLGDRGPTNESFSGNYRDPQQKAAEHLAKGLRFKDKAAKETDAQKQQKLLEKAKKELQSSATLHPNHDAMVALGQVFLALGNPASAVDACNNALMLKPNSATATACIEQAKSGSAAEESTGSGSR